MRCLVKKVGLFMMIFLLIIGAIGEKMNHDNVHILRNAYEAVKAEYGDFYIPSKAIDSEVLESVYGISVKDVDAYIAESAMMSTHVDVFIGIKAKKGKCKEIEAQLKMYREKMCAEFKADPATLAKIEASKVYNYGDYLFFMILGQNTDEIVSDEKEFSKQALLEIKRGEAALTQIFK